MGFDLNLCLRHLIEQGGSDLHLKVPAPPVMRIDGLMRPIDGLPRLTGEDTDGAVRQMLDDPNKLAEFAEDNEVDFSYSIPGVCPGARSTTSRGSNPSCCWEPIDVAAECRPVASAGGCTGSP